MYATRHVGENITRHGPPWKKKGRGAEKVCDDLLIWQQPSDLDEIQLHLCASCQGAIGATCKGPMTAHDIELCLSKLDSEPYLSCEGKGCFEFKGRVDC